ncbi:MAG: acylphosphatase [bacterium]|nr:acylphosphatase [bacterium]
MAKRITIKVDGRVQGVLFRRSAQIQALALGLTGLARNEGDGSVAMVAEGDAEALERFLAWCRTGSPFANVTSVVAEWQTATGEFERFEIL